MRLMIVLGQIYILAKIKVDSNSLNETYTHIKIKIKQTTQKKKIKHYFQFRFQNRSTWIHNKIERTCQIFKKK